MSLPTCQASSFMSCKKPLVSMNINWTELDLMVGYHVDGNLLHSQTGLCSFFFLKKISLIVLVVWNLALPAGGQSAWGFWAQDPVGRGLVSFCYLFSSVYTWSHLMIFGSECFWVMTRQYMYLSCSWHWNSLLSWQISDKGKVIAGAFVVVQQFVMLMPNIWRSCFG